MWNVVFRQLTIWMAPPQAYGAQGEANMQRQPARGVSGTVIPLFIIGLLAGVGCSHTDSMTGGNNGGGTGAVALGSAATFGVLAGQSVSNSGATTINADLGIWPGNTLTGAPGVSGSSHLGDITSQKNR